MVFGSIADIFFQWEYYGVFDFVLPFLLVFAIVFGILTATNIMGHNKGVAVIIAFVIGLMSLRWQGFFSTFLSELFPRLGIGIAVLLSLLILVGLFIAQKERRYWGYGLAAIGVIIFIVILYQTFSNLGWYFGGYGSESVGFIVLAVLIVGVIIAVAASGGKGDNEGDYEFGPFRMKSQD
ncbi:MAG: hypothetical protein ABIG28_03695 [archaeon]